MIGNSLKLKSYGKRAARQGKQKEKGTMEAVVSSILSSLGKGTSAGYSIPEPNSKVHHTDEGEKKGKSCSDELLL